MTPFYQSRTGDAVLYLGDAKAVLREMPAESVQCVITSPPYFGLRDYGCLGQYGLEATLAEYLGNMVEVFREVRRVLRKDGVMWVNCGNAYASQGGDRTKRDYGCGLEGGRANQDAGAGCRPPKGGLKPKDLCGLPWRLAFALQEDGWWLRSDCI